MRAWIWRPKLKPQSPINEENYRCCFNLLTVKKTFIVVNILICLALFILFLVNLSNEYFFKSIVLVSAFLMSILALVAARTMIPGLMQFYLIVMCPILCFSALHCWGSAMSFAHEIDDKVTLAKSYHPNLVTTEALVFNISAAIIYGVLFFLHFWYVFLIIGFYQYLRDRQIAIEEPDTVTLIEKTEVAKEVISSWLWEPSRDRSIGFSEENYKFCCMRTITFFRINQCVTFLILLGLCIFFFVSFLSAGVFNRQVPRSLFFLSLYPLSVSVIGLIAAFNRKPFYTQLHLFTGTIISVINFLFIIPYISLTFGFLTAPMEGRNLLLFTIITIFFLFWEAHAILEFNLRFRYYHYARDRQIAFEDKLGKMEICAAVENISESRDENSYL